MQFSRKHYLFLLTLIIVSSVFFSPKWFTALAVWIHFPALLLLLRNGSKRWWLFAYLGITTSAIIGQEGVFPMPMLALVSFMFVANLIGLLPLLIDRLAHKRLPGWASTLVFPVAATLLDLFAANGPQGTWGNAAYTQFHFRPLMQIAAVTGVFGINFLYYWFASSVATAITSTHKWPRLLPWFGTFTAVLLFGFIRLAVPQSEGNPVTMAAVHLNNNAVYETMYEQAFDSIIVLPQEMDFTSPEIEKANQGMMAFMAAPEAEQFTRVYAEIENHQAKLLASSKEAAEAGAKIICWSEAAVVTTKDREENLQAEAARFADLQNVYLLYATAVFHPEKVGVEDVFIENKVITYGPNGEALNVYFKNIPVMGIEPSFPGDGIVPSIATVYGNISPLICYDADHPQLVAQLSENGADLMVVPTGDWAAIAPFHTYMAAIRSIENGVGMLKATNHGLSAIIDNRGNIVKSADLTGEDTIMMGELALARVKTPYTSTFPIFAGGLQIGFLLLLVFAVYDKVKEFKRRKDPSSLSQFPAPAAPPSVVAK